MSIADDDARESQIDRLEDLLVEYDEQGQLFGTSGAGAYFLAKFLAEHGCVTPPADPTGGES